MTPDQKISFLEKFGRAIAAADPGHAARLDRDKGGRHRLDGLDYASHYMILDAVADLWSECGRPEGYASPLDWLADEMASVIEQHRGVAALIRSQTGFRPGGDREAARSTQFSATAADFCSILTRPEIMPEECQLLQAAAPAALCEPLPAQLAPGRGTRAGRRVRPRSPKRETRDQLREAVGAHLFAHFPGKKLPTQEKLAEALGCDVKTIGNWERGEGSLRSAVQYRNAVRACCRVELPLELILAPLPTENEDSPKKQKPDDEITPEQEFMLGGGPGF